MSCAFHILMLLPYTLVWNSPLWIPFCVHPTLGRAKCLELSYYSLQVFSKEHQHWYYIFNQCIWFASCWFSHSTVLPWYKFLNMSPTCIAFSRPDKGWQIIVRDENRKKYWDVIENMINNHYTFIIQFTLNANIKILSYGKSDNFLYIRRALDR